MYHWRLLHDSARTARPAGGCCVTLCRTDTDTLQIDTDIARQLFDYVASAPNGKGNPPSAVLLCPSCEGVNPSTGDEPFLRGSGELRMRNCSSAILAWVIRLPEPDKEEITFHEDVQRQRKHILKPLIAAGQ